MDALKMAQITEMGSLPTVHMPGIKRVKTALCVGPWLSELVVTAIDDANRFKKGKQIGAYAGLTPRQWQSGERCIEGHISRAGIRPYGPSRELWIEG